MMQTMSRPEVRWGAWIGAGCQMIIDKWQVWIVQMLIAAGLFAVPIVPFYAFAIATEMAASGAETPVEPPVFLLPLIFLVAISVMALAAFLWGGFWKTALK